MAAWRLQSPVAAPALTPQPPLPQAHTLTQNVFESYGGVKIVRKIATKERKEHKRARDAKYFVSTPRNLAPETLSKIQKLNCDFVTDQAGRACYARARTTESTEEIGDADEYGTH